MANRADVEEAQPLKNDYSPFGIPFHPKPVDVPA